MKLLVLAQTPPPLHGQSVMVETLVTGLPAHGIAVHHVNLRLSRDAADIGRWRAGKIGATLAAVVRTVAARFRHGCDTLYYVPAPGKRGALYRDWLVMLLCRPFFPRLVLHWHACGLGDWLATRATAPERWVTRRLLGCADLAIVLAPSLRDDAVALGARRTAVVPNGIADPGEPVAIGAAPPHRVAFLGLCTTEKGLFAAARAVLAANERAPAGSAQPQFTLTAAGPFDTEATAVRWRELASGHRAVLRHVGFVNEVEKRRLLNQAHVLCFPTQYAAEAFPIVAIEALAHDRPVIATRWRGLPDIITPDVGMIVPPGDHDALVDALVHLQKHPPATGACRARFVACYQADRHLALVSAALLADDGTREP